MTPREIVRYQKLGAMGYVAELDCKNDSRHPSLIPDIDNPNLAIRCVVPDCGYYREIGLQEQSILDEKMRMAQKLIEKGYFDEV